MVNALSCSLLVPVHNESANIRPFYERALATLQALAGLASWQIVFINDGSTDDSGAQMSALRAADPHVKILTLSRNFGYHAGLVAGLSAVDSDLYGIVDVDGEDPPELFKTFYEEIRQGADVVYGIRSSRQEGRWMTFLRAVFYHINRLIADSPAVVWMGEFSLVTRQARNAIIAPQTTYPFIRAEMAHVGFKRVGVPYRRAQRMNGQSHYHLLSMIRFAVAGFLAGSTFPLRLVLYLAALAGTAFPLLCLGLHLRLGQSLWLLAVIQFYFLLIAVPMLALYLARTYKNGIGRPIYVVDQRQTFLS